MEKVKAPDINRQEGLLYLRTSARLLADHFKGTVPICGVLTSPMDLPAIIMGAEDWLELLLFDREKARSILESRKEDKHFIFASTAGDVAWDTPLETITGIHALMAHYGADHD